MGKARAHEIHESISESSSWNRRTLEDLEIEFTMIRCLIALIMMIVISAAAWFVPQSRLVDIDWRLFPEPTRIVEVEPVSSQSITQKIMAPGHLQAARETRIIAPFSGTIAEVLVTEDQLVKAGQILIQLDDKPFRTALDVASRQRDSIREMYDATRTQFGGVEKQIKQWETAYPEGTQAPAELIQLREQLEKLKKQAEKLNADYQASVDSVKSHQANIEKCAIKAPHNGTMTQIHATKGDMIGPMPQVSAPAMGGMSSPFDFNPPSTPALMTVSQTDRLIAKAWVDETDVAELKNGQSAQVSIQQMNIGGVIEKIASTGRRQGEAIVFDTVIALQVPPHLAQNLRAGMSAMVEMAVQTRSNAMSVPVQAVVQRRARDISIGLKTTDSNTTSDQVASPLKKTEKSDPAKTHADPMRFLRVVYVLRDNQAVAVPVEIGISDEEHVEILTGLEKTDLVVTGPFHELDRLLDDTPVQTRVESNKSESDATRLADSKNQVKTGVRK